MSKRKTRHIKAGLVAGITDYHLTIDTKGMKFRWCDKDSRAGINSLQKGVGTDIEDQAKLNTLLGYLKERGTRNIIVG